METANRLQMSSITAGMSVRNFQMAELLTKALDTMTNTELYEKLKNCTFLNLSQVERDAGIKCSTLRRWLLRRESDVNAGMRHEHIKAVEDVLTVYSEKL